MAIVRACRESPLEQGGDEEIAYRLTTTPWGSTPGSVSVKAFDITTDARTDVTATVLTGAASVNGDVITCPVMKALTADHNYRLEIKFTCSGNVLEAYALVNAKY